jgi:nitrite reductase (NO-forming)
MAIKSSDLAKHVAVFRIIFGLVWTIDAIFKWQPSFAKGFMDMITSASQGQPSWLMPWFNFWVHLVGHNPHLIATLTAVIESLIAVALIIGLARRMTYISGFIFSLLVWSVAEGFGGPYSNSSTDIGAAVMYSLVFLALYGLDLMARPPKWAVDNYISKRIPWWPKVAEH